MKLTLDEFNDVNEELSSLVDDPEEQFESWREYCNAMEEFCGG